MKIKKRDGREEVVKFDKITSRIKKQTYGLNSEFVDAWLVAKDVIDGIYDGISSKELDILAAETSASLVTTHPDYSLLASRLLITSLYKEKTIKKTFSESIEQLYNYVDPKTNEKAGLISDDIYNFINLNKDRLNSEIVTDRNFLIDYFGYKTLERAYLLKINGNVAETPQYMWMRVACGIWGGKDGNIEEVIKTYDLMSQKYFTHATPTLFNAGTKRPQMSSCFLLDINSDSIKGIYKTLGDVADISQHAGGIGLAIHKIRGKGAYIKGTNGTSNGIVPMLRAYNETARYVDQGGGKRKGSFAIYLEPWHSDVEDFLDLRKNQGKEEMRTRDLFTALWIPDLFFERVQNDEEWSLFSPDQTPDLIETYGEEFKILYEKYELEGKAVKKIKARDLLSKIQDSQLETGTPYMLSKDSSNLKSNQKNLGTIKSSNLCVAPETKILTDKGYVVISEYEDKELNVWNGKEYSTTVVKKTGENQKLLKINFSNGQTIECTEYHKFYVQKGYLRGTGKNKLEILEKDTNELEIGDKLIKFNLPIIDCFTEEFKDAYTQGFFSGDGCTYKEKNHIDLYGEKFKLVEFLKGNLIGSYSDKENRQRFSIDNGYVKFEVPLNFNIKSKLEWFAGLCDSDGVLCKNSKTEHIQIGSINKEFLLKTQLMLQTLGIMSKVTMMADERYEMMPNHKGGQSEYFCQKAYRLLVGTDALYNLQKLGFSTNRLKLNNYKPNRNAEQFIKIISIEDNNRFDDTYCVNEPKEHKVIFNGVLTGNCTEIIQYSSPDETSVCNLASIALPMFIEKGKINHQKLYDVTYQIALNLNRVIDVNYYPTPETRVSNLKHRPMGIGVQGLADLFAILKLPFDSKEAKDINKEIFETIYFASLTSSCDSAKLYGKYESYENSPISKGIFQFDMWDEVEVGEIEYEKDGDIKKKLGIKNKKKVSLSNRWDWEELRNKIKLFGVRNSLQIAPMPTASTSQILGNNEAFEPFTSNIYKRNTLSGEHVIVNKYLVNDLIKLGLWSKDIKNRIIYEDGSVQNIDEIPNNIKETYKTVWEIKQKDLIDMSADRGVFICQSQSFNLHIANANKAKLTSASIYGWLKGLKTLSYYIRTKSMTTALKGLGVEKSTEIKSIPQPILIEEIKEKQLDFRDDDIGITCSLDNPEGCMSCGA